MKFTNGWIELACTMTCKLLPCCKDILQTFKRFMASMIHKMASAVISEHLISNTPNSYECLHMHTLHAFVSGATQSEYTFPDS